jgi:hypothetical protein
MSWFVVQCERKTWTKYLVEAADEEAAFESSGNWQYLGYVDGEDTESQVVSGSFESKVKALADTSSYVEG